jgi:hypothetical protein
MTKIFPNARDYKTINVKIEKESRLAIEKISGSELLPGQRESFQYFDMLDDKGKRIGTVIAASQRGEYGAIEFVVGFDTLDIINGLYIQRSREKNVTFKERSFLDQFIGKPVIQVSTFDKLYKGNRSIGSDAVIRGLKKEFASYNELVSKQ